MLEQVRDVSREPARRPAIPDDCPSRVNELLSSCWARYSAFRSPTTNLFYYRSGHIISFHLYNPYIPESLLMISLLVIPFLSTLPLFFHSRPCPCSLSPAYRSAPSARPSFDEIATALKYLEPPPTGCTHTNNGMETLDSCTYTRQLARKHTLARELTGIVGHTHPNTHAHSFAHTFTLLNG